jgi:hypothetical protein
MKGLYYGDYAFYTLSLAAPATFCDKRSREKKFAVVLNSNYLIYIAHMLSVQHVQVNANVSE